jgi:hypothetical protein
LRSSTPQPQASPSSLVPGVHSPVQLPPVVVGAAVVELRPVDSDAVVLEVLGSAVVASVASPVSDVDVDIEVDVPALLWLFVAPTPESAKQAVSAAPQHAATRTIEGRDHDLRECCMTPQ